VRTHTPPHAGVPQLHRAYLEYSQKYRNASFCVNSVHSFPCNLYAVYMKWQQGRWLTGRANNLRIVSGVGWNPARGKPLFSWLHTLLSIVSSSVCNYSFLFNRTEINSVQLNINSLYKTTYFEGVVQYVNVYLQNFKKCRLLHVKCYQMNIYMYRQIFA
jgi:hypothetical protein